MGYRCSLINPTLVSRCGRPRREDLINEVNAPLITLAKLKMLDGAPFDWGVEVTMVAEDAPAPSANKRPVIDFHTHALDPAVYERCVNHNVITGFGANPEGPCPEPGTLRAASDHERYTSPQMHVKEMDALGVDIHVISGGGANSSTFWARSSACRRTRSARQSNHLQMGCNLSGARFVGMFTLPMQDVELAIDELDYAVNTLGLRIANLPAESGGFYLGDPRFRLLWEAIDRLAVVVWIHPDGMKDKTYLKYALWNGVGQPIQETLVFCSLMYEGVLDAFPRVKIVMSHGGGFLPHYMPRLDRNYTAHPISRKN